VSTVAPELPLRRAVAIPNGSGSTQYVLSPVEAFRIEALSFVCDTSGSNQPDDVRVQLLQPTGDVIADQTVGFAQDVGRAVQYSVALGLNPCDNASWGGTGSTPDTFADIVLLPYCAVVLIAVDSSSGTVDNNASLVEGRLWVEPLTVTALDVLSPLLTPLPIAGVTLV